MPTLVSPRRPQGTLPSTCPCTVCGAPARFIYRHPDADLFRCPQCDHCFSDVASLRRHEDYAPDYYQVVHQNWFRHAHTEMFAMMHGLIQRHLPGARSVLDVGCGKGNFLRFLRSTGAYSSFLGNDLSPMNPEQGVEFIQGDFHQLQLPQFDVVVSLAVIEHVADVRQFAARLVECCKPGGVILVMTLNDRSILYEVTRFLFWSGIFPGAFTRLYSAHHLNHFNYSSLQRLFRVPELEQLHLEKHDTAMGALDIPSRSRLGACVNTLGVWGTMILGQWTGRTFLQTLLLRKKK